MPAFKSDFLRVMSERGFIHQISDEAGLDELFTKQVVTAYVGYDATATSLHIGNLITVTMLYWLQETGHRPITLMGGGTSMIGDPSFRDDQRQLLSPEKIETNIEGIKKIFGRIRREWHLAIETLLDITGQERLLQANPLLERSVRNRFPYLDPLNHVQVELLKEHRAQNADEQVLRGIQLTINGISAGLRNTG